MGGPACSLFYWVRISFAVPATPNTRSVPCAAKFSTTRVTTQRFAQAQGTGTADTTRWPTSAKPPATDVPSDVWILHGEDLLPDVWDFTVTSRSLLASAQRLGTLVRGRLRQRTWRNTRLSIGHSTIQPTAVIRTASASHLDFLTTQVPRPSASIDATNLELPQLFDTPQRLRFAATGDAHPSSGSDDCWPAWDDSNSDKWAKPRPDPEMSDTETKWTGLVTGQAPPRGTPLSFFLLARLLAPAFL